MPAGGRLLDGRTWDELPALLVEAKQDNRDYQSSRLKRDRRPRRAIDGRAAAHHPRKGVYRDCRLSKPLNDFARNARGTSGETRIAGSVSRSAVNDITTRTAEALELARPSKAEQLKTEPRQLDFRQTPRRPAVVADWSSPWMSLHHMIAGCTGGTPLPSVCCWNVRMPGGKKTSSAPASCIGR